jgi:3-hydroxyacyl-[acyl-carrier-protein] dehydratase
MTKPDYTSSTFILEHLPHRPPFLLVDKVIELSDDSVTAQKLASFNEPYFQGHFPEQPIMPGVLIVEAMAQAAGLLMHHHLGTKPDPDQPFYLASIKEARFKQIVVPGNILTLKVRLLKNRNAVWQFEGEAFVDDALAAQAEFVNMQGAPIS